MIESPRWAVWAAHAVPLALVPSSVWRIAQGFGVDVGFTGQLAEDFAAPGWITPYVIVLSLVTEGLALLTLGLVRPWGERLPRWLPLVGGRRVPIPAAVVPAMLGATAVTAVTVIGAVFWNGPENNGSPEAPQGLAGLVMTACYAPLLLWGPLLAAVTVSYHRRRRSADRPVDRRVPVPSGHA